MGSDMGSDVSSGSEHSEQTVGSTTRLFAPMLLGRHKLSTRLVMAPLTRFRVQDDGVPLPFVKEYYVQRAAVPGTLLITEGTLVSARAGGWPNAPGIWSREQISAWREIVKGVHEAGGVIFMQLFAMGRVADPETVRREANEEVKGPSPIAIDAKSGVVPKQLSSKETWEYVDEFAQAARNAIEGAGFDGVEVHGANGYLIDQFIQDNSNQRSDEWGGSIENRARFALELTSAVVKAVGKDKVGFRLSPWSEFQGMKMKDVVPQFGYLVERLRDLDLAYLHLVESRISGANDSEGTESLQPFIHIWGTKLPVLIAGGFNAESAALAVDEQYRNQNVAIVFGRHFLSNPDLIFRLQRGIPLNKYVKDGFYTAKERNGYIDYPFSTEFLAQHQSCEA